MEVTWFTRSCAQHHSHALAVSATAFVVAKIRCRRAHALLGVLEPQRAEHPALILIFLAAYRVRVTGGRRRPGSLRPRREADRGAAARDRRSAVHRR